MSLTRKTVALLILTALSLPIAYVLGDFLGIKSDTGIETIPSTFIDPALAFYSVPIRVTVELLADISPAAPLWNWIAIMFAGVLVQHFVLYGATTGLIYVAKTLRMTATSSMDSPLSNRVALKNEANGVQDGLAPVGSNAPESPSPRRRPISGAIAVTGFLLGIVGAFFLVSIHGHGEGGLGALILGAFAIGAGCGVGVIASIVAIVRKERWMAMHVIVLLITLWIGLWILSLFRPVPSPRAQFSAPLDSMLVWETFARIAPSNPSLVRTPLTAPHNSDVRRGPRSSGGERKRQPRMLDLRRICARASRAAKL
jgi:hypothetical protein